MDEYMMECSVVPDLRWGSEIHFLNIRNSVPPVKWHRLFMTHLTYTRSSEREMSAAGISDESEACRDTNQMLLMAQNSARCRKVGLIQLDEFSLRPPDLPAHLHKQSEVSRTASSCYRTELCLHG